MLPPVLHRRVSHHALEDAMELRVAAEASLQRGIQHSPALAVAVDIQEALHSLAVAKVYQRETSLLFE